MNKQYMKILYHYLLYSIDCEPRTESILIETPSFAEKLAKSEEIIDVLVKKIDNLNNNLSTAKSDAIKVAEEFRELLKSPDLQERCTHYKGDLIAQLMLEFSYKMKLQSISDLIPNPHTSYIDPNTPFFWYSPFNPLLIKVLKDNQELTDLREKEQPTTQDLQRIIDLEDYPLADDLRNLAIAYNVDGKILESDIYSIRVIEEVGENATLRDLRWATNAYIVL